MTAAIAKIAFVVLAVGWYLIRYEHARRSRRAPVVHSARGPRETALLLISLTGLGIVPIAYIATGIPHFADYSFRPWQAWLVSLDVREGHQLITDGIYRRIRHPMYSAFWLWALAQALVLPNWVAGFAGLAGFGILFFGLIAEEERMMLEAFGGRYRDYMARTYRVIPLIF